MFLIEALTNIHFSDSETITQVEADEVIKVSYNLEKVSSDSCEILSSFEI